MDPWNVCMYVFVCVCVCVCVCMYVCRHMCVCMYVCMYVCLLFRTTRTSAPNVAFRQFLAQMSVRYSGFQWTATMYSHNVGS